MDQWEVPENLRRQMVVIARQFRKAPTPTEAALWELLRGRRLDGVKFRRQQNIGPFVVDFFAAAQRLIVEVDGPVHETQQEADRRRQELLESLDMRFVRVMSEWVETDIGRVMAAIRGALVFPHPPAPSPMKGQGEKEKLSAFSPSPFMGEGAGG
jgi:very-short-patch-repair endonuclease